MPKILILSKIVEDADTLVSAEYKFHGNGEPVTITLTSATIQKYKTNRVKYMSVHPRMFNKTTKVVVVLNYAEETVELEYPKEDLKHNPVEETPNNVHGQMRVLANDSPFEDTEEGRATVLSIVQGLYNDVAEQEEVVYGTKNLIYFTVFGAGYVELTRLSLESIHRHTPAKEFDVLFICDRATQTRLEALDVMQHFNAKFFTVPTPRDGIDASINKTKLFDWTSINEYSLILFLDSDILARKNVNQIFTDDVYETEKLYVVYNPVVTFNRHRSYTHGVVDLDATAMKRLVDNNQRPANFGQFLIKNSLKMKGHFMNMVWWINNYPTPSFYEQAIGCSYFSMNLLMKADVIQKHFSIIAPNTPDMKCLHDDGCVFIHFAGFPSNADKKLEFIKLYQKAYMNCTHL